jgi:inner membrane protein
VENLTHSLLGAVIAEAALPAGATRFQRGVFYTAGILAANLPDADLAYTSIMPSPLGYLLQHRGHTHTIVGLLPLALLIWFVTLAPSISRELDGVRKRFWLMAGAALGSHILADSWNSYGVHPFWPIDNRWLYGDSVYILEPWLWTLLGVSVVMNTQGKRARLLLAGLLIALPIVAAAIGMTGKLTPIPLAVIAVAFIVTMRNRPARARASLSLALAGAFVLCSYGLGAAARARAELGLRDGRPLVDIVMNPRPANPLCWNALAIQRDGDDLVLRSATVALARTGCETHWTPERRQSIAQLRTAAQEHCDVRAWLQFGRVPVIDGEWIADARYGGSGRGNFSAMRIAPSRSGSDCPPHLTAWRYPRADVLTGMP